MQTDGLWGDQVTEEGGEQDEHQGIGDPGQVLQGDVPLQLPVDPLVGWRKRKKRENGERKGSK